MVAVDAVTATKTIKIQWPVCKIRWLWKTLGISNVLSAGILNRPNFQTRVTLSLVQCNLVNLLRLLSPPWPATTTTGDTAATVTPPPTSRRRTSLADTLLLVLTMARDRSHMTSAKFWNFFYPLPPRHILDNHPPLSADVICECPPSSSFGRESLLTSPRSSSATTQ